MRKRPAKLPSVCDEAEAGLFREAVEDVRPLQDSGRVLLRPDPPRRKPQQLLREERRARADSLSDHFIPAHELEGGEHLQYLRAGHSPDILRKMRRGYWAIRAQLDLHGMVTDEARSCVAEFLLHCLQRNIRCVRIIHGKGLSSKNREPVLKNRLQSWLMQREEVLAYCQAREMDGGSGALVVLLKAG